MEPAAIRHKNPGAMWPGPIATKWGSKKWVYLSDGTGQGGGGKGNKIGTFDNWVDASAPKSTCGVNRDTASVYLRLSIPCRAVTTPSPISSG